MKTIPVIQKYMSTSPHTIGSEQNVVRARAMMREHGIRHLPVLHGGQLVGVLSDRDIKLVETVAADPSEVLVADAMTEEIFSVGPDRPLDEVAAEMAERKLGSTLVVQNGKVVGMFTTTDACKALADLLHTRLRK